MICRTLLALLLMTGAAAAQVGGAPTDCSGTVGAASTAIQFPSSGNHGPPQPHYYLSIVNSAGVNKLAVNSNGAAVIDSSGSLPMDAVGAGWTWSSANGYPPPASINIIGSGAGTPYTCKYQ